MLFIFFFSKSSSLVIILFHPNPPLYLTKMTLQNLTDFEYDTFPHPPDSPDQVITSHQQSCFSSTWTFFAKRIFSSKGQLEILFLRFLGIKTFRVLSYKRE